ncbi:hypothetical protein DXG01_006342 [Tephrocybe rancida]|nr:hypothetical protein DXG01_006342 [Tephrocybe rancida]
MFKFFSRLIKRGSAEAERKAKIDRYLNSPTLQLGDSIFVNRFYEGSTPYQGPEMVDPTNKGKIFIPLRNASPQTPPHVPGAKSSRKKRRNEDSFEEMEEFLCAGMLRILTSENIHTR